MRAKIHGTFGFIGAHPPTLLRTPTLEIAEIDELFRSRARLESGEGPGHAVEAVPGGRGGRKTRGGHDAGLEGRLTTARIDAFFRAPHSVAATPPEERRP